MFRGDDKRGQLIPEAGTRNNCSLNKRGQLTLFIVIGLVVVLVIGGGVIMVNNVSKNDNKRSSSYESGMGGEKDNIMDCFRSVYENSLGIVGIQGGYYDFPESEGLVTEYGFVPYYYDKGEVVLPSKSDVEIEIASLVDFSVSECLKGYEIGEEEIKTTVEIGEERVRFVTDVDVVIGDEGDTKRIDFSKESTFIDSSLYYMLAISSFVANYAKDNDEKTCISCLEQLLSANDLLIEIVDMKTPENDFLFLIYTEGEGEYPKVFEFLNRYNKGARAKSEVGGGEE